MDKNAEVVLDNPSTTDTAQIVSSDTQETKYTYDYPRPALVVDLVVVAANRTKLLLVERKNKPWKGMMALPGGFVDIDETIVNAAIRELHEETGLCATNMTALGWFDEPTRDPRGRVISLAFLVDCGDLIPHVVASDDVHNAIWVDRRGFQDISVRLSKLAADHDEIVGNALGWGHCRHNLERLNHVDIRTGSVPRIG